ncbi:ABC transporter permease [Dialister succinatiphilus]|uniref:ABC transporter permease n=1 Tax=Dialister succinatiphilus TaxID=487173 RepID=UPI00402839A3
MKLMKELHGPYRAAEVIIFLLLFCSLFAPLISPYDPLFVNTDEILQYPSFSHWLGTDALGRDILSRTIYGARTSVAFAVTSALCTMVVGLFLGMAGGYFGGFIDRTIQCLVCIFQGLPGMSLMIAIAAILPENNFRILIALTLTSWTGFSRIVRSEVIRIRSETYMEGIRSLGGGHGYILRRYVFPNVLPVVVVLLTLRIGTSLLSASALSYLGLGVTPPVADWGVMINDSRTYFRSYPLMILAPGLGITLFCLAINLLGDGLQDHWKKRKNINGGERF